MRLDRLVATSREVGATRKRLSKRESLAACLRETAEEEVPIAVCYLSGTLPQGRIGIGPAVLRELAGGAAASAPSLEIREVDRIFTRVAEISGKGSQAARREQLGALFERATREEQSFLVRLVLGELRQGALEGILIEAIADAAAVPAAAVRRAVMLAGEPATVAVAAIRDGEAGLARFRLSPLSPIQPMLAQPAEDIDAAIDAFGECALDVKLDGARVQIHKLDDEVRIFSRRLSDVTDSLPEVVDMARALAVRSLILDGEVIALREDGRPHPFQVTMRRFGRKQDVAAMRERLPLSVFAFDCMHRDGADLIDRSARERFQVLSDTLAPQVIVARTITADRSTAATFFEAALANGHEGVMAKSLSSPYAAGARGADWMKIKQAHTFDLVVIGAEWGSGRRQGWLSNLHLAARDAETGEFVMLGKTFKGLTDETLAWQTDALLAREIGRDGHVVKVRPDLVVEIAVNEIQTSPHYPAGMALRFARVKGYRVDKSAREADSVDAVRALHLRTAGANDD